MRVGQFKHSCIYSIGLLLVACASNGSLAQSPADFGDQIPQGRLTFGEASTIQLPALDQEKSPSDTANADTKVKVESEVASQTQDKNGVKSESGNGEQPTNKNSQEPLTPLLNRELTIRVQAVSLANEKVGTGLVPQSGNPRSGQLAAMPSGMSRGMLYSQVCWRASNIQHFPLYFEDAMLERHGHTKCWRGFECTQSLVSGVKFFGTIPMLPYLRTLRPKHDCVYALGHYRAGSGAPCLRDNIPYDSNAAIVESGSAALFFWAMPL